MLNRAYVYTALGAFFAEAVGLSWLASNRNGLIVTFAFLGGAIGLAIHELATNEKDRPE